jgi:lysozyme
MTSGPDLRILSHYFESCRLTAYPDPASPKAKAIRAGGTGEGLSGAPWTIGWGDTQGVSEGMTITQAEADTRWANRIAVTVEPAVRSAVHVDLAQGEFDALCSIFDNAGQGNMRASTLVRLLNAGDHAGAAAQFPRWNLAGGLVMKGLQRRREAERLVFLGAEAGPAIQDALKRYP